eukprot:TRINITY_DN105845_c0_g1_i1.p1 TRINITY_DN105845_c0_g1~~TRINITY_DN105845_c0_g1_i1.p1  ORF type:complete len:318 (+),score=55.12 TRINITY_DN105845_c0_g1_i1:136-954(+)
MGDASLKRTPAKYFQRTKICRFHIVGACEKGSACHFAHSTKDVQDQPDFSKTRLCKAFMQTGSCEEGLMCRFAHGQEELRRRRSSAAVDSKPSVSNKSPACKTDKTGEKAAKSQKGNAKVSTATVVQSTASPAPSLKMDQSTLAMHNYQTILNHNQAQMAMMMHALRQYQALYTQAAMARVSPDHSSDATSPGTASDCSWSTCADSEAAHNFSPDDQHQVTSQNGEPCESGADLMKQHGLVVKNTFIDLNDAKEDPPMKRSSSEPILRSETQ